MKVHKRAEEIEENIYDSDESIGMESNGSVSEDEDEEELDESSTEEVFGIDASSDEDEDEENEESASDFDVNESAENKEDENIMGSKSWGKRKKYFYQTDTATKNSTFRNEEEEEAAKMEELEAMTIQKRLAAEIDNVNLLQDLFPDVIKYDQKEQIKNKEVIEIDLMGMNENEKHILLNKEYPELLIYINDFKKYMLRIKNKLHPLLSAKNIKKKFKGKRSDFWEILHTMYEICMTYCTNIVFYVLYRLRRSNLNLHPVLEKLLQYKMLIKKLDSIYSLTIEPVIDSVLNGDITIDKIPETNLCFEASSGVAYAPMNEFSNAGSTKIYSEHVDDSESAQNSEEDINSTKEDGKRKITYEMAKNKGLTPRRKKEFRNPRVKLRNKYRKAKIRRKGQIREPRKQLKRYSGEVSGINPHVSRSVSLKF